MKTRKSDAQIRDAGAPPLWHYGAIALLPALLTLINPNWCFANIGNMDAWYYFGDFHHFPRFQNLRSAYPSERLAWIVPGYFLTHLLGAANGEIVLHVLVYLATLYLIHYIVRKVADHRTALATTILLGSYPCFIGSNGWDYVESMPMALLAAALALALKAHQTSERRYVLLFFSAAMWFAMIYSFLAWAAFTPIFFGLMIWAAADGLKLRPVIRCAAVLVTAGLVMTALFWGTYLIWGAHGFFYRETVHTAISQFSIHTNPWIDPLWMTKATWLVLPVMAMLLAIAWIVRVFANRDELMAARLPWLAFYAGIFLVMIWFTVNPNRLLGFDYDASILVPAAFVVLGITLLRVPVGLSNVKFYFAIGVAALIAILPLERANSYLWLSHWEFTLPGAGVLLVCGVFPRLLAKPAAWVSAMLLFGLVSSCLVPGYSSDAWRQTYNGRQVSERVSVAVGLITSHLAADRYPIFWFDNHTETDPLTGEFRGIWCSFVAPPSMTYFPKFESKVRLSAGDQVFVVTRQRESGATAVKILDENGVRAEIAGEYPVSKFGVTYWLSQLSIR